MTEEMPVRDRTVVKCARCGRTVSRRELAWVELASGRLRMTVLEEVDDNPEPFRRAWHFECFG